MLVGELCGANANTLILNQWTKNFLEFQKGAKVRQCVAVLDSLHTRTLWLLHEGNVSLQL